MFHRNLTCFRAFQTVASLKLAMEKIILKWTKGRSKGALFLNDNSNDPCDVFLDPFSIVAHEVCLLVSAIFNPNLQKMHVRSRGRSAAALRIILVGPHNCPRMPARNNHRIPRKKLSFLCHVPYTRKLYLNTLQNRRQVYCMYLMVSQRLILWYIG